jgi:hypothetical protein
MAAPLKQKIAYVRAVWGEARSRQTFDRIVTGRARSVAYFVARILKEKPPAGEAKRA